MLHQFAHENYEIVYLEKLCMRLRIYKVCERERARMKSHAHAGATGATLYEQMVPCWGEREHTTLYILEE